MARALATVLKSAREAAGLSQAAAARAARIDPSSLSRLESQDRGDLRFETVARLAATYGVSLDSIAAQCGFPTPVVTTERQANAIAQALEYLRAAHQSDQLLTKSLGAALATLRDTLPRKRRPNK